MFTRQDYIDYFDQIARVERKMIYGVHDLAEQLQVSEWARILQKIGGDEIRHYGYILKIIPLIDDPKQFEQRRVSRKYCLGNIKMHRWKDSRGEKITTYCVNLSKTGVCLEGNQAFLPGEKWELEIHLFGKKSAMVRRGKVVWSKEIEPDFSMAGISFYP